MPVPVDVIWSAPRDRTSVLPIESWLCERINDVSRDRNGERCLLLELAVDDIGEYFITLMTVSTEPCVGGDAIFVEDTKSPKGFVTRITIAGRLVLSVQMMGDTNGRTWRKQTYGRSSTTRGPRDHAGCCDVE